MKRRFNNETRKTVGSERYTVTSLDRAIDVLEVLANTDAGHTLADLASETGVPKSTLFRILSTLEDRDCVTHNSDNKEYGLGLKLRELGSAFIEKTALDTAAVPYMRDLAERCEASIFLAVLERAEVVYIRRMENPDSVMMVRKLGHRAPVHCTATGGAMLAFLPAGQREEIIEETEFTAHTPHTNTDPDKLRHRLNEVRDEGVAIVDGEYNPELLCISAPVLGDGGIVEAAVTVAMPSSEAAPERTNRIRKELREKALALSREVGYSEGHYPPRSAGPPASL